MCTPLKRQTLHHRFNKAQKNEYQLFSAQSKKATEKHKLEEMVCVILAKRCCNCPATVIASDCPIVYLLETKNSLFSFVIIATFQENEFLRLQQMPYRKATQQRLPHSSTTHCSPGFDFRRVLQSDGGFQVLLLGKPLIFDTQLNVPYRVLFLTSL